MTRVEVSKLNSVQSVPLISPGVTSHLGDIKQNVIHQVRPPSTIALWSKVLVLVYPLAVLLALHPDWFVAI